VGCERVPRIFDSDEADDTDVSVPRRDRVVAVTLAVAIVILLATFIVLFIQIDPLLSDFTSSGAPTSVDGSPSIEPPSASPTP